MRSRSLLPMLVLFVAFLISFPVAGHDLDSFLEDFVESFVSHYEFNVSGRYAHEYHPFILKKTAQSMFDLENAFLKNGFEIPGRYILMGYEESAFPSFFPRVSDCEGRIIDDEASFKDPRGWCIQLHNRFGTMTGFLFRFINDVCKNSEHSLFEHINPNQVEIFSDGLSALQRYAFGQVSQRVFDLECRVYENAAKGDWRSILDDLIGFWKILYDGEYKTGDRQVVGTQDILFGIENARFLRNSPVDLLRFYVGPDITYPIVVSRACSTQATYNSQTFLSKFIKQLIPRDGKKTLYVFRSFVDGVGKSTLLGNIKNWMEYKDEVDKYEVVDNTSTLEYEIFRFSDDVFIADLPAQISHFTYKPEGMVWVDLKAVTVSKDLQEEVTNYFAENKELIVDQFKKVLQAARSIMQTKGPFASELADLNRPEYALARNLILLHEVESNRWVPFTFRGRHFLADTCMPDQIRLLCDICRARSEGLKNVQASQMIFSEGIEFPAVYEEFVNGLIRQARNIGVERVVFVDFLSMYSRSSRENIRINYLMQLMGLIDSSIDPYNSLYRNFVSNSELLAMLTTNEGYHGCQKSLFVESLVRMGLYSMMSESVQSCVGCRKFKDFQVVDYIKRFLSSVKDSQKKLIEEIVAKKIEQETKHLSSIYRNTKEFVNLHSINFDDIVSYSEFLRKFFTQNFKETRLNALWDGLEGDVIGPLPAEEGWVGCKNYETTLESGDKVRLLCCMSPRNRDHVVISRFLSTIRSAWYSSIINVLFARDVNWQDMVMSGKEYVRQIPVLVKKSKDGRICLVEKALPRVVEIVDGIEFEVCQFEGVDYIADYTFPNTAYGMFGFGCDVDLEGMSFRDPGYALTDFVCSQNSSGRGNTGKVLWTHEVMASISEKLAYCRNYYSSRKLGLHALNKGFKSFDCSEKNKNIAPDEFDKILEGKIKNALACSDERDFSDFEGFGVGKNVRLSRNRVDDVLPEEFSAAAKMFARMIVSLEMIARDVDSVIAVGRSDEDFFAGIRLVEEVLLPQIFGISLKEDSFFSNSGHYEMSPLGLSL